MIGEIVQRLCKGCAHECLEVKKSRFVHVLKAYKANVADAFTGIAVF